ncbi:MAG: dihydropteroate synthase [Acidobacteriota bacterium]
MKLIRSTLDIEARVQIMGILNVTPDSFSDGGQYVDVDLAVERAFQMVREGANIIDIGGESTRPSSSPVSEAEELARVLPVLERLSGRLQVPISIDTTKTEVARAAIEGGAELINDIGGLRFNQDLAVLAAETGAALVLMHSRGTPERMQRLPVVADILLEVKRGLRWSIDSAIGAGVGVDKLIVDPGIGFGKTAEQNLQLIDGLDELQKEFGLPILLGVSRKSFIDRTMETRLRTVVDREPAREKMFGTAASVAIGVLRGARIVRVHDVAEMVTAVRMTEGILDFRF